MYQFAESTSLGRFRPFGATALDCLPILLHALTNSRRVLCFLQRRDSGKRSIATNPDAALCSRALTKLTLADEQPETGPEEGSMFVSDYLRALFWVEAGTATAAQAEATDE